MNIAIYTVVGLLSTFFLFAGSIKILGWQKTIFTKQLEFFQSYGLTRQIMMIVGMVEIFGATTVWFQHSIVGVLGAAAIFATSAGAIFFHLHFDTWKDGIPAMATLVFSAVLLVSQMGTILDLLG